MKVNCKRCEFSPDNQALIQEHHLIPKCIGGTDLDGRNYLCKKCHDIIHGMLLKVIFEFVPENKKDTCRKSVKQFSLWFINKKWK